MKKKKNSEINQRIRHLIFYVIWDRPFGNSRIHRPWKLGFEYCGGLRIRI